MKREVKGRLAEMIRQWIEATKWMMKRNRGVADFEAYLGLCSRFDVWAIGADRDLIDLECYKAFGTPVRSKYIVSVQL